MTIISNKTGRPFQKEKFLFEVEFKKDGSLHATHTYAINEDRASWEVALKNEITERAIVTVTKLGGSSAIL